MRDRRHRQDRCLERNHGHALVVRANDERVQSANTALNILPVAMEYHLIPQLQTPREFLKVLSLRTFTKDMKSPAALRTFPEQERSGFYEEIHSLDVNEAACDPNVCGIRILRPKLRNAILRSDCLDVDAVFDHCYLLSRELARHSYTQFPGDCDDSLLQRAATPAIKCTYRSAPRALPSRHP